MCRSATGSGWRTNLGLSTAAAKGWQVQHVLLKRLKEITQKDPSQAEI
jgi:hypothetical protein